MYSVVVWEVLRRVEGVRVVALWETKLGRNGQVNSLGGLTQLSLSASLPMKCLSCLRAGPELWPNIDFLLSLSSWNGQETWRGRWSVASSCQWLAKKK